MKYLLLCIAILTLLCSCALDNTGYNTWTLQSSPYYQPSNSLNQSDSVPQYTFEYPTSFMELPSTTGSYPPYDVRVLKKMGNKDFEDLSKLSQDELNKILESKDYLSWFLASFEIYIVKTGGNNSYPEKYLDWISNNQSLLEKDSILVNGLQAERTIIQYYYPSLNGTDPNRVFSKTIFHYDGFNWYIMMDTPQEKVKIMEEYYNHLLKTFKIQR